MLYTLKEELQPQIICSVKVDEKLCVYVNYRSVLITQVNYKLLPAKVDNINELQNLVNECHLSFGDELGITCNANDLTALTLDILNSLKGLLPEKGEALSFLKEQAIHLNVHRRCARYSAEFLIFPGMLKSISPHTYHFIRSPSFIILPSESTVKSLNSHISTSLLFEQDSSRLLRYIWGKFSLLVADDKSVLLLMDEIHVKSMDYKRGSIVGASDNGEKSTSACVFMVCSLQSLYKDVAHIIPVHKMTGKQLHSYILEIIIGLEDIGFEVFGVISDNNPVNRKAISLFADPPDLKYVYVHPKTSQMQCRLGHYKECPIHHQNLSGICLQDFVNH